ncbi:MAG: hypothetical protein AAFR61_05940 [Bacteroidota bacterium]
MLAEKVRNQILSIIEQEKPEAFVVELKLVKGKNNVLSIKVDTDEGISLDECVRLSRAVGHELEEEPLMDFPYRLELSSPGVGSPLLLHRQYVKNQGRFLKVRLEDSTELKGQLIEVDETFIVLGPLPQRGKKGKQKKKEVQEERKIMFAEIIESKVIII